MSKTICTTIRQQLDEMRLGEKLGIDVSRHLTECRECREFHDKQTKLREIVGSLGTVNAPSDFDFRLRSRLAGDNSNHQRTRFFLFGQRTAAVAAAMVLIVGAALLVRQLQNRNASSHTVVEKQVPSSVGVSNGDSLQAGKNQTSKEIGVTAALQREGDKEKISKRNVKNMGRTNRFLVSEDLASSRAPLVRAPQQALESVFPIDASQQSLKVSLFDGRGNPRTISLPTVTFGSQRVVPTATSFAPKGVW